MHLNSIFRIQELLKTLNGFLKWEEKLPISASTGSSLSGAPRHSTARVLCSGCAELQGNCFTFAKSLKSGMGVCWSLSHSLQHLLLLIVSKWSKENRTQNLSPLQCGMSADSSRAEYAQGRLPKKDPSESFLSIPAQN